MYNVTKTHFRDLYGKFLWAEPLQEDYRLYSPGEEFMIDGQKYKVERVALVENTQHINLKPINEDLNILEPYL